MKKGDWIKTATAEEIQNHIEKLEQNICSCKEKIEWYKQEQERRKQLGVPCEGRFYVILNGNVSETLSKHMDSMFNSFHSEESAEKHAEMLLAWRKALVANAKGEPIDIKVLFPLLPKGYVAMDKFGLWCWYYQKPDQDSCEWKDNSVIPSERLSAFNIKRADDWKTSLMECGL